MSGGRAFKGMVEEMPTSITTPRRVGTGVSVVPHLSFDDFYAEEAERLLRALILLVGSAAEAEELTQEAFVRVFQRWERVRVMDDPTGYLFRTAMNLARSRWRRVNRIRRQTLDPATVVATDPTSSIDAAVVVRAALRALTDRQRAAIVLTVFLEFTPTEAADVLGVRPSTVRALTTQARERLREVMGDG